MSWSRSSLWIAGAALCLGGLGGCATDRSMVTWDDAIQAPPTAPPGAARRVHDEDPPPRGYADTSAPREPITLSAPRPSSPDDEFGGGQQKTATKTPAGLLIDRALTHFNAMRAGSKNMPRRSPVHATHWLKLLSEIDDACTLPPTADDLGAFIRARATLEVEFELDQQQKRALPKDLKQRIDRSLGAVDSRVAELRLVAPPGSLGPSMAMNGSEVLVLHAPVNPMVITSPFGVRDDPIHGQARFHAGVDFGAPTGTMVYAASKGVIIFAAWQGGYGRHVVIDHGGGVRTHYSHLDQIFVNAGEVVETGDTIGAVGMTGRATGPHLHFSVTNHEGHFLDPQMLLDHAVARKDLVGLGRPKKRVRKSKKRLARRGDGARVARSGP